MPKAHEVASELRKLADSLDREPDVEIPPTCVSFSASYQPKEEFLAIARLLPRPWAKKYDYIQKGDIFIDYDNGNIRAWASTERSKLCRLVKPAQEAVYECDPLLSAEEEAALETAVAE